jgi:hypothetical protein
MLGSEATPFCLDKQTGLTVSFKIRQANEGLKIQKYQV